MNNYEIKDSGCLIEYLNNKYKEEKLCIKEYQDFYCIEKKQIKQVTKKFFVVIPKTKNADTIGHKLVKRIIQYFKQIFGY